MNLVSPDDPILYEKILDFAGDAAGLEQYARGMHKIMMDKDRPGLGIAAPQVGLRIRMFVMNTGSRGWGTARACINPVVVETKGPLIKAKEGCLTRWGLNWDVVRHEDIRVEYTNLGGNRCINAFTGINARVFQHELDHLCGRTIWGGE